jgi:hypothetical protein
MGSKFPRPIGPVAYPREVLNTIWGTYVKELFAISGPEGP